jgi:hypothetical protein
MASEASVDDEFKYHGYLVGRPTRSAEVSAPDGTSTIEEGTLTFELAHKEDIRDARVDNGWTVHYVAPDGGVGFGLDEGNSGGVTVPYDLVEIIPFPQPMTQDEADEWWDEDRMLEWAEEQEEVDLDGDD